MPCLAELAAFPFAKQIALRLMAYVATRRGGGSRERSVECLSVSACFNTRGCDLFDGRLEEFGVREHINPRQTTEKKRCLTDGQNYLWVFMDDDGFVSSLTRWATNGDPAEILDAIAVTLDTGIASEHQPQYWASKHSRNGTREPNDIKPGTNGMRKAEIAKKLVEKNPGLLIPENKRQLRKVIVSAEIADGVKRGKIPF
jgi:hypothetical protein